MRNVRNRSCSGLRKAGKTAALAAGALCGMGLFLLAPGYASRTMKAPFQKRNFAHRGLHTKDKKVPENSLTAFELAAAAGYGIELDVHLSKDGSVVVFHDDTLERVCGVPGRVEDLTLAQLQQLKLCGSEETIPLFTDVLNVIHGRGPLIVEIKTGSRNRELCRKTLAILRGYAGDYCIESFDPTVVAWFRFHAPDLLRGQLACPPEDFEAGSYKYLRYLLGSCLFNALARPHFIAYKIGRRPLPVRISELLGAMRVGWTSHEAANEKGRDAVIFEFYRPERSFDRPEKTEN